ncbi:serine hydrolase [Legionella fallonii]|uniref:Putative D-alanyl-D-alanine-carboxypeptidase/endopeptidase AmpH n=1 Tax=Legionella fallonii LLAP-10 TaxID=1212491 RepID=A0A098G6Y6_9GAMM|nr:serine hydrolase [Legionella fallonii]CEG57744.1 putative D-alanyl-D-alanine-carboxypeptidase/endopeptidase AmpH [Legionella fallonii LLAP-10]
MLVKRLGFSLVMAFSSLTYAAVPACSIIEKQNVKTLPLEEITDYVNSFVFQQSGVPGLMIGIISGDERAVISCGETVRGNNKRPQMDTIWSIGSVSKVFTTQMLAELVNRGGVRLNTTIDELIGEPAKQGTPITLLDLATHTSGFPRMLPTIPDNDDYQVNTPYAMEDFLRWYQNFNLQFKPGSHYQYSNVGFGILGQLLAKKMDTDYGSLLATLISKPLGLKDTTITLSKEQKEREVASYWVNDDLIKKDWDMGFEVPSGGIYSSMEDMLKFTEYQLGKIANSQQNNQIAHASYIYQYQLDNPLGLGSDAMALGWNVYYPSRGIPLQLEKNGWVNGVNTYVQLTPTQHIGLVSLTNKPFLTINSDLKSIVGMIISAQKK